MDKYKIIDEMTDMLLRVMDWDKSLLSEYAKYSDWYLGFSTAGLSICLIQSDKFSESINAVLSTFSGWAIVGCIACFVLSIVLGLRAKRNINSAQAYYTNRLQLFLEQKMVMKFDRNVLSDLSIDPMELYRDMIAGKYLKGGWRKFGLQDVFSDMHMKQAMNSVDYQRYVVFVGYGILVFMVICKHI